MTTQEMLAAVKRANDCGYQSPVEYIVELEDILEAIVDAREEHDYETAMSRAEQLVGKWERT